MKAQSETLSVQTMAKNQMLNLTSILGETVGASGIRTGFVGIYSQHTTAALFVSEFQAALIDDVLEFLKKIVREELPYKHNSPEFSDCKRQNAASHLRSLLLNQSVFLPVVNGQPVLGQYQSVILAELDGPRERKLEVQVLGQ